MPSHKGATPEEMPGPDWCPPHPIAHGPALVTERDPIAPWSRLPNESEQGWQYFLHFRNMAYPEGPLGRFQAREIKAMAAALSVSPETLYSYSGAFIWHDRAGAYDRAIDAAKVSAEQGEIVRVRSRHLRLLEKTRLYAETELDKLQRKAANPETTPSASAREIKDLLEFVIKTERLLMGEVTDRVGVEGGGEWDLEKLPLEHLEALEEMRRIAQVKGG